MAKQRTGGRKEKSRNKGYFYRKDRGGTQQMAGKWSLWNTKTAPVYETRMLKNEM